MTIMDKVIVKSEIESSNEEKEYDSEESDIDMNEQSSSDEDSKHGSNADNESNDHSIDNDSDEDNITNNGKSMNLGWADSIQKILKTNKPKNKKTLVLSRAKKLTDNKNKELRQELGFEIEGEIKEEKLDPTKLIQKLKSDPDEPPKKKAKPIWTERTKPNILDKDRERTLSKIATKGIVQLFNVVRMQQKDIGQKLEEAGPLERKRDKVLKSIDKRSFLDVLMGGKSEEVDRLVKKDENIEETNCGDKETERSKSPTWNVLRDDFMMGGKLKDWDKKNLENEASDTQDIDLSDSS